MTAHARAARIVLLGLLTAAGVSAVAPAPASAFNPINPACGAAGVLGAPAAKACGDLTSGRTLVQAGKQLLTGNVGGAVNTAVGSAAGAVASTASTALGLAAVGTWVLGGAQGLLHDTAAALGQTTTPQLRTTWFSSRYWGMAAIASVLTLPFLFAAAIQALIRSDVLLLARAAFGYLPVAMLAIVVAAPLTTLLLAASDQMCGLISSAAGNEGAHFLEHAGVDVAGLAVIATSPFLAFLVGLFTIGAAFALWIELLLREAAVYVIVLMLPLSFAALVWPARRIWAIRAVEVLVALILSKFAIVAVLSLGGAAISDSAGGSVTGLMVGAVLITLAAFSPWALLRLVPLAEIASGAAGSLRGELRVGGAAAETAFGLANSGDEWVARATAAMRREAEMPMADAGAAPQQGATSGTGVPQAPAVDDSGPDDLATASRGDAGGDEPAGDGSPRPPEEDWSSRPVLELGGPNFRSTPVWPNPKAE